MKRKILISSLIVLFALALLPQIAKAQVQYPELQRWYQDLYSYGFGMNWIRWHKFDWKVYKGAEHVDIYYYITPEEKKLHQDDLEDYEKSVIKKCVRYAETAYRTVSEKLKYEIPEKHGRAKLYFYLTRSDYEQSNIGGTSPPGGSAFAEMIQWRVVLVRDDYTDEFTQKLTTHEMTHIFQFSLWWGGKLWPSPANPKIRQLSQQVLFLLEGMAQYIPDIFPSEYENYLRWLVLNDHIPQIEYWTVPGLAHSWEINYLIAREFWKFIEEEYGEHAFRSIVHEFKKAKPTFRGTKKVFKEVLQKNGFADFNRKFRLYLKNRYKASVAVKKEVDEYGRNLLTQENLLNPDRKIPRWVAEPVASPTGDLIGVLGGELDLDILIISGKDGTSLGNLTKGLSWNKYGWWITANPNSPGRNISWSPDGDYILFFSRTGEKRSLFIVELIAKLKADAQGKSRSKLVGKVYKKINLDLDEAESPEMSADGKTVVFSALEAGQSDLFLLNLENESITNLTNDEQFDYAPTWSPDGKRIIYVVNVNGYTKLFSLDVATGTKTQLTFGPSNEIRPAFSKDGSQILFISDRGEHRITNIYALDIQTVKISQITDLLYGISSFCPLKDKTIVVSSLGYKNVLERYNYNLHLVTPEQPVNDDVKDLSKENKIDSEPQEIEEIEIDEAKIEEYKPLKNIHVAYISGQGTLDNYYGQRSAMTLALSDSTGDHRLYANYANFSWWRYKYFSAVYVNLSKRMQYAVEASVKTHYLYPYYLGRFFSYTQTEMDDVLKFLELDQKGLSSFAFYPLDAFHRVEFSLGAHNTRYQHPDWQIQADYYAGQIATLPLPDDPVWQQYPEGSRDAYLAQLIEQKELYELRAEFLESNLRGGTYFTLGAALVRDTTRGTFIGSKQRLDLSWSPGGHNRSIRIEAIKYLPLSKTAGFALRGVWSQQRGNTIHPVIVGEFAEIPRYGVIMKFTGNDFWMTTAELRFPFIKQIDIAGLGPIIRNTRAALFADIFEIKWSDDRFNAAFNQDEINPSSIKGVAGINLSLGLVPFLGPVNLSISKRVIDWSPLTFEQGWRYRFYLGWEF